MGRFIAVDPSSKASGWAVFEDQALVAWGTIDASEVEYSYRFQFIVNELKRLHLGYEFQEVVMEETRYSWRGRNLSALQVVFMSVKKWVELRNIGFKAYNVATWKSAVVGHVHASKETTKENVCLRFPNLPRDLSDHEYDAVAIGVYHSSLRFLAALGEGGKGDK